LVVAGGSATRLEGAGAAAEPVVEQPQAAAEPLAELPHEDPREEPYRPELVARLERAVRQGRYSPDPHAIADALVKRLDELE